MVRLHSQQLNKLSHKFTLKINSNTFHDHNLHCSSEAYFRVRVVMYAQFYAPAVLTIDTYQPIHVISISCVYLCTHITESENTKQKVQKKFAVLDTMNDDGVKL